MMNILIKTFLGISLVAVSHSASANETYICTIKEEISANFNKGKWVQTNVKNGNGLYRVIFKGKKATVIEQGSDKDTIKTNCNFVGGTIGYKCDEVLKITPYGERINIRLFPELNEITIDSEISMREMDAYDKGKNRVREQLFLI